MTFIVGEDRNIVYVTRGIGEEYLDKNLQPTFKSGRRAIGVWSCYYRDEIAPLIIIKKESIMTVKKYLKTAKKHFILFYKRMKRKYRIDVVIQEDNAP